MRHCLERSGFVFAPDRQIHGGAERIGPLDQLFFATASGSLTITAPRLRLRTTTPVSHQLRLFCQLRPAWCSTCQIVEVLTVGRPSSAWRKARCSMLNDH